MTKKTIEWGDFALIEIRVGTVIAAEIFREARKPAYKITIDFGEFGTRHSSAQITKLYSPEELIGMQVTAVVNFPSKQIANFMSECLILGVVDGDSVTLLTPERKTPDGLPIG